MADKQKHSSKKPPPRSNNPVPRRALEAIRAFGGYSIVVTSSLQIVYLSPDANDLPIATKSTLTHPWLAELASDAWRSGRAVVRHQRFDNLGPIEQAEVTATKLAGRCILLTIHDATATRRIEQVRHDLISNIGHELRTPVAAVRVIAETLPVAQDDPPAITRFSERLLIEAERMSRLIEDILALAKAQSPDTELYKAVDLAEITSEACHHQATHSEVEGVALMTRLDEPIIVMGDASALVTAIDNLIDNAINYSTRGSTVAVTAEKSRHRGIITVTDHGIGIDDTDQTRIFERFYRSDQARSRRTGGTGLGLAIVKNVALGHDGTVSVHSSPGQGSTFTIELPLVEPSDDDKSTDTGKKSGRSKPKKK